MIVALNGERLELERSSVAELVARLIDPSRKGIAVAKNGEVVPRSEWDTCLVRDGDSIEVLHASAGG
jgi:sulfur carrier protein